MADQDIDAAVDFYRRHANPRIAFRFIDAVEATLSRLVERPGLGNVRVRVPERLRGCRRWPVRVPFHAHQIFYLATRSRLDVVRVLHGARDLETILAAY
jgi:toxin ParE1/3/4